jgi:uncharacterized protein YjiS (DUF1127 family)
MTDISMGMVSQPAPSHISLFSKFTQWHHNRLTRKALYKLDDHLLRDIGLERCDIKAFSSQR